jgi:non-homologous end joining protein Ku
MRYEGQKESGKRASFEATIFLGQIPLGIKAFKLAAADEMSLSLFDAQDNASVGNLRVNKSKAYLDYPTCKVPNPDAKVGEVIPSLIVKGKVFGDKVITLTDDEVDALKQAKQKTINLVKAEPLEAIPIEWAMEAYTIEKSKDAPLYFDFVMSVLEAEKKQLRFKIVAGNTEREAVLQATEQGIRLIVLFYASEVSNPRKVERMNLPAQQKALLSQLLNNLENMEIKAENTRGKLLEELLMSKVEGKAIVLPSIEIKSKQADLTELLKASVMSVEPKKKKFEVVG